MCKNLVVALIKAKSEFKPIKKDASNPFFKSKYLSLDGLLDAVEGALSNNGLLIVQTLSAQPPALVTTLYHESGESISGSHPLPEIADPQKFGSAITYARRYSICAILSITADDDDANTAGDRTNSKPQNSKPQSQGTVSREEWLARQGK